MIDPYDEIVIPDVVDLRLLRALQAVAEEGSFAAAAGLLGCSQPAVSQQIAQLEAQVGTPVFFRRPVRLTEAGRVLLAARSQVATVLAAAQAEIAAVNDGEAGEIRVGAFDSACARLMPSALHLFRVKFPGVRIVLVECETHEAHRRLQAGDLDIAVTFDYDRFPVAVPRGLRRSVGMDDPVAVAVPASHPLAGKVIELAELADAPWIETPVTASQLDQLAEIARVPGFRAQLRFDGDDFRTVLNLVAAGLGVALLPTLVLADLPVGAATCRLQDAPLLRRIHVDRPDTVRASRSVTAMEASLRHVLREP
jgi:DNA-binding transcriptional LysR family regulator